MQPRVLPARLITFTTFNLAAMCCFLCVAHALDWRIIQDELGAQLNAGGEAFRGYQFNVPANEMHRRGKLLFAQDFEDSISANDPENSGITLVSDTDTEGTCLQLSTSGYHIKDLSVIPGHWVMVSWKARMVSKSSQKIRGFVEVSYLDKDGQSLGQPVRQRAYSGAAGIEWKEQIWSLAPFWSNHLTMRPPDTRSIVLRFFHESNDQAVTLVDDIRVTDIHPVVLQIVADMIGGHQRLLTRAGERIAALPDSPRTSLWKQVVVDHGDRIASELQSLTTQEVTGESFIDGSDPPLLFARRLADAADALEDDLAHPATVLTYRTRPFPVNGAFYHHHRSDPVGVRPYASQIEGEVAKRVSVMACPGEYEPVSIALWSPENLEQVSVHAPVLKGSTGLIPTANLDIKVIKCWYQRTDRPKWPVLVPRFLLNDDALLKVDLSQRRHYLKLSFPDGSRYVEVPSYAPAWSPTDSVEPVEEDPQAFPLRDSDSLRPFDLVAGQNKQLWLTLKVPQEAAAGQYSGDIVFRSGAREIARFEVNLRVLPFSLPAPKTRYDPGQEYTFSIYYRGLLNEEGKGMVGNMEKSRQQFRAELRMMVEHGIKSPLMVLSGHWPTGETAFLRRHLQVMREVGMSGRALYLGENIHRVTDQLDTLRRVVSKTVAVAREYGFTDVYLYGQDEASGEMLRTKQLPSWRTVHEGGGKVQVSVTYHSLGDVPDELDLVIGANLPQRHLAQARHRLGHKIHSYAFPFTNHHDPLIYRRNCGLVTWSYDYDGVTPYCFMHNQGAVWNDLDGTDISIAFPTIDGAVSTLALEAIREAADDVRYATLLMQSIEAARQTGTPDEQAVAERAYQWVMTKEFLTADLDRVRTQMVDYITHLPRQ